MNDFIRKNELKNEIESLRLIACGMRTGKKMLFDVLTEFRSLVLMKIDETKPVDAVEVVRCKDCKWKGKDRFAYYDCCVNPNYGMASGVELRDNDFCSYGERRGNDER